MEIILVLILTSGISYYSYVFFIKFINIAQDVNTYRALDKEIKKKWIKIKAEIKEVGINTDYSYPYLEPEIESDISSDKKSELKEAFLKNSIRAYELHDLHGGINITYSYEIDNKIYIGRDIGILPDKKDIQLAYKAKKGSKRNLWVNPHDHNQSFLRTTDNKIFEDFMLKRMAGLIPSGIICLIGWLAVIYTAFG